MCSHSFAVVLVLSVTTTSVCSEICFSILSCFQCMNFVVWAVDHLLFDDIIRYIDIAIFHEFLKNILSYQHINSSNVINTNDIVCCIEKIQKCLWMCSVWWSASPKSICFGVSICFLDTPYTMSWVMLDTLCLILSSSIPSFRLLASQNGKHRNTYNITFNKSFKN